MNGVTYLKMQLMGLKYIRDEWVPGNYPVSGQNLILHWIPDSNKYLRGDLKNVGLVNT